MSDARVQVSRNNILGRSRSRVHATQPDPQDIFPKRLVKREESGASPYLSGSGRHGRLARMRSLNKERIITQTCAQNDRGGL